MILTDPYWTAAYTREAGIARMDAARTAAGVAIDSVAEHADTGWRDAALDAIRAIEPGKSFLSEDIVGALKARGITTHDSRAAGPVMQKARSLGLVESVGYKAAATSNLAPKCLWTRCA